MIDGPSSSYPRVLTNSPLLVKPVVQIDDNVIGDGKVGTITLKVLETYRAFVESQCAAAYPDRR